MTYCLNTIQDYITRNANILNNVANTLATEAEVDILLRFVLLCIHIVDERQGVQDAGRLQQSI